MGKKMSIQVKYGLVFLLTLALVAGSFMVGLTTLRDQVLRNEAEAVADQVIAFRAWVAGTGMVWVNKLAPDFPDFLASRETVHGTFYGKNPALATRELSTIANKTALRATFLVTSDEYRQTANKPDDFENKAIARFKNNSDLKYVDGYVGDSYRYARPIFVKKGCLKCHGNPEDAPPEVIQKYGADRAFGYRVGDVRGIVSVKLPTISWKGLLSIFSNPIALGLIFFAFLLNFLFTQRVIIKRLSNLTNDATAIAKGKLSTPLNYTPPEQSNDEIDHAYHAVNLLKKSMNIIMKRLNKK
jgi:HAMP domain-containing protein